jgi:hypothetical protein
VPWAGDNVPVNQAVAEGAAPVQAEVVDGVKLVAEPEERHVAAIDHHHLAAAWLELAYASDSDEHPPL